MYSRTTLLAASGPGVGLTAGARPKGRALERAGTCSWYVQRNVDLDRVRKFPVPLARQSGRRTEAA